MSPPPPLLAHVHLPKTAGQAVRDALYGALGHRVLHVDYATDPAGTGPEVAPDLDYLQRLLAAHAQAAAITSHCFRFAHPERLGGRPVVYAAFLREPLEQARSWIRYLKGSFAAFPPATRRFLELPDDLDRLSLVEIAQRLIDGFREPPGRGAGGFWFWPCAFFGCHGDAERAIEVLRRFAFVGVSEDLPGGLRLLQAKLARRGLELELGAPRRVNVSPRDAGEARALERHRPLERFVAQHAAADAAVYAWAAARYRDDRRREKA